MVISVYERLSMVVSFILIGLGLYFVIDLPTRQVPIAIFNQTISISLSDRFLMLLLLGGLAFSGSGIVVRTHPERRLAYTRPFWANATGVVLLATMILTQVSSPLYWAVGLAMIGIVLWSTLLAEYHFIQSTQKPSKIARLWSQWISYAIILGGVMLLYETPISNLFRSGILLSASWALSASILKWEVHPQGGIAPNQPMGRYSFAIGLIVAQFGWILYYWPFHSLQIGLSLFLIFYLLIILTTNLLYATLSKSVILEYGLVSVIVVSLIISLY